MNVEDGIYQKCGEIYLANTKSYSFLCCSCNELFYEFTEFKVHSLVHLDKVDLEKKEICSGATDAKLGKYELNDVAKVAENSEDQDEFFIDLKEKLLNENIDTTRSIQNDKSESNVTAEPMENETFNGSLDNEKLQNTDEELVCPYCKILFKTNSHDVKRCCRIRETINKNNGDFIKLLKEGILCCCYCKRYFEDYKKLYEHHIKAKHCFHKNQCKICKFHTFMNSKINLSKQNSNTLHTDENNSKKTFQCQEFKKSCGKCFNDFNSKIEYDLHMKNIHDERKNDEISEDDFDEDNNLDILNDVTSPVMCELPFSCSLCERVFRTKSQMKIHMRVHTNERPYKCEICSAAFTVAANLKNHIIYKHTDDRPFVCEYEGCGAKFKLYDLKRQHEKRHLPANLQCEMCGNYYKTKFNLLKHQQSKHVDAKDWPHQCDICSKRFVWLEHLADHKRIHTGEKPFGCDLCPKFFRRRNALREHKKLHSDLKKYICRFCGKGFKQRAGYWGHMKRHPIIS